jgi:uncharacterized protein YjiK
MRNFLTFALLLLIQQVIAQVEVILKSSMAVAEPSDIASWPGKENYLVLADKAFLYEYTPDGNQIKRHAFQSLDLEAITCSDKYCYVSEETLQRIHVLDVATLNEIHAIQWHHGGGRNEGVEALVWLEESSNLLASTEKDPQFFTLFNESLQPLYSFRVDGINEVSALTYHDGHVYVLSDEQSTIYKLSKDFKKVEMQWSVPMINPEGMVFQQGEKVIVLSDDGAQWVELKLNKL